MAKISVIMGIFNCASTLSESIECILKQTYDDWELIMCDDGSTDDTVRIAQEFTKIYPDKIILLKNENNLGLNKTLNKCLSVANGKYIARMDGDDLCDPQRFEKEIHVLENESDISIVSTDIVHFDETGNWGRVSHNIYPDRSDFLHGTPFCHAPCMVKREAYLKVSGYTESKKLIRVEDYHLWIKLYAAGYKGKNINEPLYMMRDDRNAASRRKFKYRLNEAYVRALAVKKLKLPVYGYLYTVKPILVGLLPSFLYNYLHKKHLNDKRI